ncbi:MAG TPA: tetratricopeptide repeat protein [Granulicella sp.]|jgi:tetratricopeptide (TPR) repeat protein/SAM-dependent methyltransferase|nr:tetratricopeptide repeat protein [Granulicella sp.]
MSRRSYPFVKRQQGPSRAIQKMFEDALRHHQAERLAEAETLYRRILRLDARHSDSLHLLGTIVCRTGRHDNGVELILQSIAIQGNQPIYHSNLGTLLREQGKYDEAIARYKRALDLNPDFADACHSLGNVYQIQGKLDDAIACYERALVLKPDYVDARNSLGTAFETRGKMKEATACYEQALALNPDCAHAHTNLGNMFKLEGKLDAAAVCHERALELMPGYGVACSNLGAVRDLQGRFAEAVTLYELALAQMPNYFDAKWNQALMQLLLGDFAAGLPNYECRWLSKAKPRNFPQPQWRGEKLNGARILLHAEQGLGDTLQCLRYLPMVQAAGGSVVLEVQGSLRRIAALLPGVTSLVAAGESLPAFDWQCPLMSLPLACGTTLASIPAQVPYLSAPEEALQRAAALPWPASGLRVGIVWAGNPTHVKDRYRSLPFGLLEPLLQMEGAHFFSLQKGPASAELATARAPITDLGHAIDDMADTAALMAHLDLVIAVDTAVAHLAGALGKQVWVMLPISPDWRWLLDREDSPWYPSMRLFRQENLEDWPSVVSKVRSALIKECARRRGDCRQELRETGGASISLTPPEPLIPEQSAVADMDKEGCLAKVADTGSVKCKVCQGASRLFGVVDFNKSCIELQGRTLPLVGYPVYYRRCEQCGFLFTTSFDAWTPEVFQRHIYNDAYIEVDPDFVEVRPASNARMIATDFGGFRASISLLDYGGGAGVLAQRLRAQGFRAATYDPFSSFNEMPAETFDLITCFEVMEHVPFPKETVATMVSLLKNKGVIIFSTLVQPAGFESLSWWYSSPRNGHISLYSSTSLTRLFDPHGMKVKSFSEGMHLAYAEVPDFAAHLNLP